MQNRKFILLSICLGLGFQVSLQAQTYATPELNRQVETELATRMSKTLKDPEAYRDQGAIPEHLLKAPSAEKPAPVFYVPPVDEKRTDLYKLTAVDAVDIHKRHTASEMRGFQAEAAREFAKMNIVLDWKKDSWYFIPRDRQQKPTKMQFQVGNRLLQFMNCRACQSNTFSIVEQTENVLILHLRPQDEGQFFVYAFTFKK